MSEGRNMVAELEAKMDGKDREIERLRRQVSLLNGHDTLAQLEAHIDEQAAEIARLKAALREIANMDDPAISAQQVAADALEGKDD